MVDIDLEKFFDRVCHDRLMSRLAQRITDKRALKLIRAYLQGGIFEDGLTTRPTEGTPQGAPSHPSFPMSLDELDKELEARGLRFCRYADDSNIYVRSARAGARVMASISRFIIQRLKLQVNWRKSAVDRPWNRSFWGSASPGEAPQTPENCAEGTGSIQSAGESTHATESRPQPQARYHDLAEYLQGWIGYFDFCQTPAVLRDLDSWIRHRLRCLVETLEGVSPTQGGADQAWDQPHAGPHNGLECARAVEDQSYPGRTHGAQQSLLIGWG